MPEGHQLGSPGQQLENNHWGMLDNETTPRGARQFLAMCSQQCETRSKQYVNGIEDKLAGSGPLVGRVHPHATEQCLFGDNGLLPRRQSLPRLQLTYLTCKRCHLQLS
jgi:hypothetical protein